jgi:hypothetical protein
MIFDLDQKLDDQAARQTLPRDIKVTIHLENMTMFKFLIFQECGYGFTASTV